jgi:hypothetical protein
MEGFSSSYIKTHKDLIIDYVRELGDRGALDELQVLEKTTKPSSSRSENDSESQQVTQSNKMPTGMDAKNQVDGSLDFNPAEPKPTSSQLPVHAGTILDASPGDQVSTAHIAPHKIVELLGVEHVKSVLGFRGNVKDSLAPNIVKPQKVNNDVVRYLQHNPEPKAPNKPQTPTSRVQYYSKPRRCVN